MTEENQTDTNAAAESSAADDVASMVTENSFDFVLDKYRAEGRTDEEAAFEQAKAYTELQGRFGSFTGAPDEYALNLSDGVKESGLEFDNESPFYEDAVKLAKDLNMNQDGFDKMIDIFGMSQIAEQNAHKEFMDDEFKQLGDNAKDRLQNIDKWANANLPANMIEGFSEMAVSAKAVESLEKLISMTRAAPMNADAPAAPSMDMASIRALHNETDANGQRLYDINPDHRKKVQEAYAQALPGDFKTQVG